MNTSQPKDKEVDLDNPQPQQDWKENIAWYKEQAEAIARYMESNNSNALVACMTALSLDGGTRAEKALNNIQPLQSQNEALQKEVKDLDHSKLVQAAIIIEQEKENAELKEKIIKLEKTMAEMIFGDDQTERLQKENAELKEREHKLWRS